MTSLHSLHTIMDCATCGSPVNLGAGEYYGRSHDGSYVCLDCKYLDARCAFCGKALPESEAILTKHGLAHEACADTADEGCAHDG